MWVDTTIYGYVHDGAAYHVGCLPARIKPEEDPEVGPIFNYGLDEWREDGLSCDSCFDYIVEPREKPRTTREALVDAALRVIAPDPGWQW